MSIKDNLIVFIDKYKIGVIVVLLILFGTLLFRLGGLIACGATGGRLVKGACVEVLKIEMCELNGNYYLVGEETNRFNDFDLNLTPEEE